MPKGTTVVHTYTYKHSHLWTMVYVFPIRLRMSDIKHTALQTTQWYTAICPPSLPPHTYMDAQSRMWSTPHKNSMICRVALTWVGPLKGTVRHVDHAHYNEHSNDGIDPPASSSHKEQQLKLERMRYQQYLSLKRSLIEDTAQATMGSLSRRPLGHAPEGPKPFRLQTHIY